MIKIVITGASGFIGQAFLRRFAGHHNLELLGVGRRPQPKLLTGIRYSQIDLADLDTLNFTPDAVIHAAGKAGPWGSREEYWRDNVLTTEQVIHFCQKVGHPRLIYISTAAVYYRYQHQFSLTEQQTPGPDFANEYARSKYEGEQRVQAYQGEKTILRPCAVFGVGDSLLFPPLLKAARNKQLPILTSPDMPAQGDIMPVESLCDYLLRALMLPKLRPVYNLSNAEPVEINQFLQEVLKRFNLPAATKKLSVKQLMLIARVIEGGYRLLGIKKMPPITRFGVGVFGYSKTLDVSAALTDFGPPSCSLSDGLDILVKYYQEQTRC
ncbi:NAD(P)-dependent oxidoreductase [Klebsiella sp. BIGb0407]|uniref:NAD-dependent epimerase/dehydratase family protein n=1 Tax=Klebsiella sp. BIGb0407 TaxID=2940603 RepID=UPI00216A98EF|nr:NAD(P)-dependent oxidoreductase [Klebsiella sp. BIGb0407]MCS3430701.1 nucleoside-diphosphate-sugar epimerase [Klebsiella sp. BIGb0407]